MTNDLVQHSQTALSPADINLSDTITGGYKRRGRSARKGRKGRKTGRKVRKSGKSRKSRKSRRR